MEATVGVIVEKVAVAGKVSTLCCSILQFASRIKSVQEDWYTVTDEYSSKVDMLSASISIYKHLMDDRRLLESSFMMQTLMRAESKLRDGEVKVMMLRGKINDDQCCGWVWWLLAKLTMIFLRGTLEKAVTDVTNEINKIPSILKMQEEALCQVQRYDMRQPILPTIYDNNNLYVPLVETQSKAIEAIERGSRVVLLHGGVGKGKTTLAKAILLHYQRGREEGNLFHHVHFESCGDGAALDHAYTKMKDILQSISPTSLNDSIEKDYLSGRGSGLIFSAFSNFLKGKRILIILDHVLDPNFLHKMWQAAAQDCPQVTYLVTSQLPNLCNSFSDDSTPIAMGDTTKDEAIRILASLVGLDPKIIHDNLKDVAMEMIEATEGNLLALACLATHFDDIPYKTHEKAWLEALDDLPNILNLQERKIVLGLGLDKSPHRSLWSAMELCLNSLETREAKLIFFLIYACHGHSVPQEILTIWYECINTSSETSSCTFSRSREELRSRELVKLSRGGLCTYLEGKDRDLEVPTYGVWSLRPLVKLYIEHLANGKKEIVEVMNSKIVQAINSVLHDQKFPQDSSAQHNSATALEDGDNEKAKVAIVLCALYFDHSHANRIVIDVATKARSASNLQDCSLVDERRQAMEPIIWLLGQPKDGKWTEPGLHSARKVFLTYICERKLDGDGFAILLKIDAYPPAQLATLRALLSIFTVEETPLPWQHTMKAPLDSKERCSTTCQEAASNALVPLLEILFRFLSQHDKPDLRLQAALALTVLAFGDRESIRKKTLKEDGAVADLVKSWSQHGKGDLQVQVIRALNNLALQKDDSVKFAVVNKEGILAVLVKALAEHNNGNLQEVAASALSNLAASNDQEIKLKIGNEEGAIAGLVKCLSVKDKPALQEHAIAALSNLPVSNRRNKEAIANEPGALAGLVKLLSEHDNEVVQVNAVKVIWNLVNGKGDWDSHRIKILNEGGAIAMLVEALYRHDKSDLQYQAAGALASLASNDLVRETIVNESNNGSGLTGLVKLLSNDKGPSQEAARALWNLTCSTDDRIRAKIVCEEGALANLVKCLAEHDKPGLQELAAAALWNLARTKDNTHELKIRNENGLLTALVSLSQRGNPILQKRAKGALEALGGMGKET